MEVTNWKYYTRTNEAGDSEFYDRTRPAGYDNVFAYGEFNTTVTTLFLPKLRHDNFPLFEGFVEDATVQELADDTDRVLPYILYTEDAELRNPVASPGPSMFYGLSWVGMIYVADAWVETFEGVDKLYAAAIVLDGSAYTVKVSVDSVPTWEGSLALFFGGQTVLSFLNGSSWPDPQRRPLLQHYNFLHPEWPFRGVGLLSPFRARALTTQDKLTNGSPIALYLDEPDGG